MATNKNNAQDMLAIAHRLASLPTDKRAIFRQRLHESGIDFSGLPIIPRNERPASIPLSFAQQRLWFLHQLEPDSAAYNIPAALKLKGRLDTAALESAFKAVIARHESLRTVFREVDGKAEQFVLPVTDFTLPVVDLTDLPNDAREAEALYLAQIEAARSFDLGAGPLLRVVLLKLANSEHILAVTMHHIVSDGWSMNVLMKELGAHYAGKADPLPPLTIQYADFALWQQEWLTSDVLATQLDYWKAQLSDEHPVLELPSDRPRLPRASGRGAKLRCTLSEALAEGLRQRSREQGATLFMTMLAAFDVLLHRLSGQNDIRVGVPVANRNRLETEGMIGFFVNTQVLRTQLDARTTFAELLERVKEAALGAQAHQDLPFEQLVEALQPERNLSHSPLFQAMFNLQTSHLDSDCRMGEVRLQPLPQDSGAAQFDLSLDIVERQGKLEAVLTYSTDLFEATTIERFAGYYTQLLHAIVAAPHARIGQLAMLSEDEYRQLTCDWAAAAPVTGPLVPVHAQFEAQVNAAPDAIALVYDDAEFTYANLNAQANRLAHRLIEQGIGADARVGVCIDRSPAMIVALLAILKAGGAYVPLDPNYPPERLAYMIEDAGITLLLTQAQLMQRLPLALDGVTSLDVTASFDAYPSHNPGVAVQGQQLAYVMYTSGSTGKPKGVGMIHAALAAHAAVSRGFFRLQPGERMLQFSTFNFDGFVEQLYPALSCGATVVLRGPDLWDSEELYQRLLRHRITVADFTTAYWFQVVQDWAVRGYTDYGVLRQVNVGGEAMPPEGLSAWREAGLSHVRLLNTYGPTEAAVTAMTHDCANYVTGALPKPTQMPIGQALPGRAIYLLDAGSNPVPIGAAGELCIGGELLARGYHGRPDLTAERFIPDPFGQPGARLYRTGDLARWKADGVIEYLGRIDHQVKLRGFRIELAEIEACLLAHPAIRAAVVLVREDRPGDKRLVAYLVTVDKMTDDAVRSHVQASLPDYMVPSALVHLDAMPMNPNGKLDRKALPAPDYSHQTEQAGPRNQTEAQLAQIWSDVLGIASIGIHDNFFLLGGHSLLATRLVSRIRSALQCELPVRALFEAPTIAQLAERIEPASANALAPIPRAPRTGPLPLSFAQQRLWFLQQLEPDSAVYNMPAAVRLVGKLDVPALKQAFEALVTRHETLRTTFREEGGEAVQVIAAQADITMPLIDLATLSANAKEAEVKRIAEAEAVKPFDLKAGPLLRLTLLKLSDTEHVLLATMHHIVSDGWSMSILTREFAEFYTAASQGGVAALAPLPIQYADFAAWQRQQSSDDKLKRELDYWKTQLGTEHSVLELPADRPRPPMQSGRGARYRFTLDANLVEPLRQLCRKHSASTFMALLAIFDVLLARLSGQRDIRVGVPIANRNRLELEGLIGFFVNTQVLRSTLDGKLSFSDLLERVKEAALGAQAHQDLPFEQLVEALQPERSLSHSPLFQVMFNLIQSDTAALPALSNLVVKPLIRDDSVTQFDLSLDIVEREKSLDALFTYSTDLFDAVTIERFAGYYTNLLRAILVNEQVRIGQLPMLGDAEFRCLTRDWNSAAESRSAIPSVHKLFEAQAEATPQAVALVFDDIELSYAELNVRANQLAHRLIAEGIGPDIRVGICIERSVEMIVSLLAVLKAGGAYVPLDPNYPQERLAYMAEDAGVQLVLSSALILKHTGLQALDVAAMPTDGPAHNPNVVIWPTNLAYVMYTSGSTGKPKGVGITHNALARHSQVGREFFALQPGERMLQFSTFNFDGFVEQLYPALSCGATVVLRGPHLWDSEELYQRLLRHRITVADFTTAYWFQVVQDWAAKGYSDYGMLRQVNVGGEAMPPEGLSAWRDAGLSHVRLLNTYGPTEAAVTAMIHDCAGYVTGALPKPTQMPIGHALPGRAIYLLDADGNPVPIGVAGELCIGGELLARGYHGRPDLTAERFIPDPFGQPGARLYRTGDLARWKANGVIDYLGRIDHQVKLRGFRIELAEIEACLLAHSAIREAVVLVREDRPGDKRLVAYLVTSDKVTDDVVRSHVQASLPDYMVPSALVHLNAMPMNPNGKLDRKALPAPDYRHQAEQIVPRNQTEAQLAQMWSKVLGIEPIGIHDNFFLLGGHSLLATRLVSRIRSTLQCELPVRALFEAPTIAQLAERIDSASDNALAPIPRAPRTGPLPLSFAQQRLWFLQQLEPDSAAYNMPAAVRLVGKLDVPALKQAFEALVTRHETLRTTFREEGDEAVQLIAPSADIAMPLIDLATLSANAKEAEVKRIAEAEAAKPFDLQAGPLLRLTLIKLSDTEHVLLATMHHIVSDGWSMSILTREFAEFYAAASQGSAAALAPLAIQYADFAAWQRQQSSDDKLKRELDYWKTQLGAEHPVLELPVDHPRPSVQSGRGARYCFTLDASLVEPLRQLCRRHSASTFMALLAIFDVLLARLSGQRDIRVGVPIANRNRLELEGMIGFFVNTQVLRAQLDARTTFAELLERVKESALGAQAHQDLPFEQLVEALQPERSLSHSPLFQVMFNLIQSDAAALPELANLVVKPLIRDDSATQFDLSLDIVERETSLDAFFTYSTDLFEAATIERFADYYTNLLRAILVNEQTRIGQLPMLGDDEYRSVTGDWSAAAEIHGDIRPVHKLFEAQVEATPQAVALVFNDLELSYVELNARANWLAHKLIAAGVGPETRIGICIERSIEMIVSLLAVLKAGGAYVPLDPDYPHERLAYMIEDAGIRFVLCSACTIGRVESLGAGLQVHDVTAVTAKGSEQNPCALVQPGNLAYLMYTSGSTGQPKGVGITHDALARHSLAGVKVFALQPGQRILQFATFNFDSFVDQLYPALVGGATIVLRGSDLWDSEELYQRLLRHRITVADFTTTYWFQVIQDWAARGYTDYGILRQVNVGGEAMPPEGLTAWREAGLSHVRLLNLYGPTEATVTATWHDCDDCANSEGDKPTQVPIGHAFPGRRIYLLDADGNPVPIGVVGELCIGGELLARGYHGRPDLTAERFIPDPFGKPGARLYRTGDLARWKANGVIDYLGRIDHQVKLRGFRIELAEIEACLLAHPAIREAVVLVREDRPGDKRLVAYLVTADTVTDDAVRNHVQASLPDYMVPSALVHLDAMPMNPNGKLDRKALPAPDYRHQTEQTAPRNDTEAQLAAIWSEVLGIASIGIHDNFFLLGGHSLLATRLVSHIRSALQCDLPVRALFEAPTIAQLAERIEPASANALAPIPRAPRTGPLPLSFAQQRLWFLQQLEPDSAAYNLPAAVRLVGKLDVPALKQAFEALVTRHETLRTTFREEGGEAVQVIAAQTDLDIPLIDLSALPQDDSESEVKRIVAAELEQAFDLLQGPVLRITLIKLSAAEHVLLLVMHHIVADGWSIGVLVRDLGMFYAAFKEGRDNPLPPLSIQYADFAAWQRTHLSGEELSKQLAYWRAHLGSDHPILDLPSDRPRPAVMSGSGARYRFEIDRQVTEQLHALGRTHGATLFMTLLAAFDVWLHAHTGRLDPIVGTDIANRNRTETEGLLGFFINQLALKADLSGNPAFSELLTRTRHRVLDAYTHQDLPFNKLVEALNPVRSLAYTPLFQVKLVLQNQAEEPLALPGLEIKPQSIEHEQSEFDLLLIVTEMAGGLECILKYSTDLFDHDTVVAFAQQFAALLTRCAAEPSASLDTLAHTITGMARTARLARQQKLSTQGVGKLQATRRKSISIHSTSSFKDAQS